jgi:hypothetical protein
VVAFSTDTCNPPKDFGDAPNTYGTLLASTGARHGINPDLKIGASIGDNDTLNHLYRDVYEQNLQDEQTRIQQQKIQEEENNNKTN